ncbi:uncharacterized protein [Lolium perenne]|uniref:uncharacterized protein isoform X3 n=1 Tax=Lolium perenne TaxID=4522 RepID=UPI003A98EB77
MMIGLLKISAHHDMSLAVELYMPSVATLRTLGLASKERQCDYVATWYSLFMSCAEELQHGVVLWQEHCHGKVCHQVISEDVHCFIALGKIYRVAQILHLTHCGGQDGTSGGEHAKSIIQMSKVQHSGQASGDCNPDAGVYDQVSSPYLSRSDRCCQRSS